MPNDIEAETVAENRANALNSMGAKFFGMAQMEPAKLHFLAALSVELDHAMALQNLGAVLRSQGHFLAAESVARRAVRVTDGNPFCLNNLAVAELALRKYGNALNTMITATNCLPAYAPSWHNLGLVHYMRGEYQPALDCFNRALTLGPDVSQVQSDRALTLLSLCWIKEGLEAYEVRWKLLERRSLWNFGIPEWQGEDLEGRKILVHHEQGFGDSLMLVRFVSELQAMEANITLAVPEELVELFAKNFSYVRVVSFDEVESLADEAFDFHSPLLSVMRHIGVDSQNHISSKAYLHSAETYDIKLPGAKLKIGICWASGNHSPELVERRRVVPLTSFLPLSELPGVNLISLQKGAEARDIERNGLQGIVFDASGRLENFARTAEIIDGLDLVITVDSAVAHLVGAMGKRTIVLSPYTRCWRWWGIINGLPWYNRMALVYQSEDGSWDDAMGTVTNLVADTVGK